MNWNPFNRTPLLERSPQAVAVEILTAPVCVNMKGSESKEVHKAGTFKTLLKVSAEHLQNDIRQIQADGSGDDLDKAITAYVRVHELYTGLIELENNEPLTERGRRGIANASSTVKILITEEKKGSKEANLPRYKNELAKAAENLESLLPAFKELDYALRHSRLNGTSRRQGTGRSR